MTNAILWLVLLPIQTGLGIDFQGKEFLAVTNFRNFSVEALTPDRETRFTSPILPFQIEGGECILSWNVDLGAASHCILELRAIYPDRPTRFFTMGLWASNSSPVPRGSVPGQRDADGEVATDILRLVRKASAFQVRVRVSQAEGSGQTARLKFLGLCLSDSQAPLPGPRLRGPGWGKHLEVPRFSQMNYPGGEGWCSPTSTAMALAYWAGELKENLPFGDVPQVAKAVHDPNWPGTGNWPFNTAYAGSFAHLRAYVTRFATVAEVEEWTSAGVPVIASVAYGYLKGKTEKGNGHLVVCAGFTEDGDVVLNDPGTTINIRKIVPRSDFERAWASSDHTVYLIYPLGHRIPENRWGHWCPPDY